MTVQTVSATPHIEWDDSLVFVFSFTVPSGDGGTTQFFCGFVHMQVQLAVSAGIVQSPVGSTALISNVIQQSTTAQVQVAADPQSWLDTVKAAARGPSNTISITFDDAISTPYTTQTAQNFTLQQLFSLAG